MTENDVKILEEPTGVNLAKLAIDYADGVIMGSSEINPELVSYCKEKGLKTLQYNAAAMEDGSYIDEYNRFYDELQ